MRKQTDPDRITPQQRTDLYEMQGHPGWEAFVMHLRKQMVAADSVKSIYTDNEQELIFKIRLNQAKISIYSGLLGFMQEIKLRVEKENKKEENDGRPISTGS